MTYKKFRIFISALDISFCIILTVIGFVLLPKDLLFELGANADVARTIPKIYVMLISSIFIIGLCVTFYITDKEWFLYLSLLSYISYIYFWTINLW